MGLIATDDVTVICNATERWRRRWGRATSNHSLSWTSIKHGLYVLPGKNNNLQKLVTKFVKMNNLLYFKINTSAFTVIKKCLIITYSNKFYILRLRFDCFIWYHLFPSLALSQNVSLFQFLLFYCVSFFFNDKKW